MDLMANNVRGRRILVLGGTGAMGVYLVPLLQQMGARVYVTSRREHQPSDGLSYIVGNAHELEFVRKCVAESSPDAIVDFMNYKTPEFEQRAEHLANASGQYVFLSSYRVFNDDSVITERSPRLLDTISDDKFLSSDIYPIAKARQEDIVTGGGGQWTIIRPCITYSKERFQFGCLEANTVCYRSLQNVPVVIPSEMLDKTTTMTWGGDVAKMLSRLILNPQAINQDFNVATSESHTWREVLSYYAEIIGMRAIECTLDEYEKIISDHYHYQVIYDRMFNRRLDNRKVLKATGLRQDGFMGLKDGLKMELEWFKSHQYYSFLNVPENARMDKYCDAQINLASLSAEDAKIYNEVRYGAE